MPARRSMSTWSLAVDQVRIERDLYSRVPRVFFVAPRVVRGVIRGKLDLPLGHRQIPHVDLVVIDREDLDRLDAADLLDPTTIIPASRIALVARPDPDRLRRPGAIERRYERLLFHAVIDLELAGREVDWSGLSKLLEGPAGREVRSVLVQESIVAADATGDQVLAEFIPTFLDLWHFAPEGLATVFPAIENPPALKRAIDGMLDDRTLLESSHVDPGAETSPVGEQPHGLHGSVPTDRDTASDSAMEDPERLLVDCRRLYEVGGSGMTERFLELLRRVLLGGRDIFRTDLVGWLVSAGRRPLIRRCDNQKLLRDHGLASRLLASLPGTHLPAAIERRIESAASAVRASARLDFTAEAAPQVARAVAEAGCAPRCVVESVAIEKLVDELVDHMLEQGLASFADLRDAVSRNQYKLPDVTGFQNWLFRDPLVLVDRGIAVRLPDVYRPAPFYLLGIQRLSAVAFGTAAGRFVTTHLVLPFGGASIVLRGLAHVAELFGERFKTLEHILHGSTATLVAGGFLWCMIHLPVARRAILEAGRGVGRAMRFLFVALPSMVLRLPLVVRLLQGWLGAFLRLRVLGPMAAGAIEYRLLRAVGLPGGLPGIVVAVLLVVANVAFARSRAGRFLWNVVAEGLSWGWRAIRVHFIIGLFELVMDFFRNASDLLERLLHAVQERLQVRSGESRFVVGAKAVLTVLWSVVDECIRFCVTLLIEPQINPIKHFPVVTVSHKLLVPLIPTISRQVAAAMGLSTGSAVAAVTAVSTCIPGVFGFMAWELGENWRLYAANRRKLLAAMPVGRHGETIRRLLRRGFHSGTVPKAFARLRRYQGGRFVGGVARLIGSGRPSAGKAARALGQLEAAAADIGRFVERECLRLLASVPAYRHRQVVVRDVHLATSSLRVRLSRGEATDTTIRFVQDADQTILVVDGDGWLAEASPNDRLPFARAIVGLAAFGGARVVRWEDVQCDRGDGPSQEAVCEPATLEETAKALSEGRAAVVLPAIPWSDWSAAWGALQPTIDLDGRAAS